MLACNATNQVKDVSFLCNHISYSIAQKLLLFPGCKQQFHVTCAQSLGLLCEEAGNYLDNVKYCGYCQHHYSKLVCISKFVFGKYVFIRLTLRSFI